MDKERGVMGMIKALALSFFKWLGPLIIEILYDKLLTESIKRAEKEIVGPGRGTEKMKMVVGEIKRNAPEVFREVGERKIKAAIESHLDKALNKL